MTINSKIYNYTGDPFVDAGAWALTVLNNKDDPLELTKEDVKAKLEFLAELYINPKWTKVLYSVFPNNKITNPSVKNKKEQYLELLNELYDGLEPLGNRGGCLACGKRDVKSLKTKDMIPLLGSNKFVNFFPSGQKGASYCETCSLFIQFCPLLLYKAKQLVLIQSTSKHVLKYWSTKINDFLNEQISLGTYDGCWDSGITRPINSLFDFASSLITEYDLQWAEENPLITIYHFTNYNQGPDIEILHLPSNVFSFLTYIHHHEARDAWYNIVRKGFYNLSEKAGEKRVANAFKKYNNRVYLNLLHSRERTRNFNLLFEAIYYAIWTPFGINGLRELLISIFYLKLFIMLLYSIISSFNKAANTISIFYLKLFIMLS